jgi:ABC-2 type transport system permease protein
MSARTVAVVPPPADLAARIRAETEWSLAHRLRHATQSVVARAYPRVFGMLREPSWLFFDLVFPILGMSALIFLLRSRGADETWISATILASALLTFWTSVIWMMAGQFRWERDSGNLTLYITAPVGLGSITLGMAIGGALGMAIRAAVVIVAGTVFFGAHYDVHEPLLLALTLLLGVAAMYALGACLAAFFLISGRQADHLGDLLNEPMQLLGGLFAPVRSLGIVGIAAIGILPLAPAADALRQIAVPQLAASGLLPVPIELSILTVMLVIFSIGSHFALAYIERAGRAGGRLLTRAD